MRERSRVLALCLSALAAMPLAALAKSPKVTTRIAAPAEADSPDLKTFDPNRSDAAFIDPSVLALPPDRGGSCQLLGALLNPLNDAVTQVYGTTGNFADNFRPAGTGPVTLSAVSWRSAVSTTAATAANVDILSYTINIYPDNNGVPGPAVVSGGSFTVSTTAAPANLTAANAGTFTFNNAAVQLRDFTATLSPSVTLQGGQCYWIEFVPTGIGTNAYWHQAAVETEGDGVRFTRLRTAASYDNQRPGWGDMHFCFNFPLESTASGSACPLSSVMACSSQAGSFCQINDGFGFGSPSTAFPITLTTGGTSTAVAADDFAVTANTRITSGCFQGFYSGAGTPPAAPLEQFRIRIYPDAAGVPSGTPAFEALVGAGSPAGTVIRTAVPTGSTTGFSYSFSLANGPTLAAGKYWIEIVNTATAIRWNWALTRAARPGRGGNLSAINPLTPVASPAYAFTDLDIGLFDQVMCLSASSGSIIRADVPQAALPLANRSCATASSLPLTGEVRLGHTFYTAAQSEPLPPRGPFAAFVSTRYGNWYTITGDGNSVTVSTCNAATIAGFPGLDATQVDTVINVYCASPASPCSSLTWIDGNDDLDVACAAGANSGGASTVTFPTVAGDTYYVYVFAFNVNIQTTAGQTFGIGADRGFYFINATTDGVPANPPQFPCSTVRQCQVQIPAGAVASAEACGSATDSDNLCSNATTLQLGQWGTGTIFGFDGGADLDLFRIPSETVPPAPGGRWYQITVQSEQSVTVLLGGRGVCTNDFPAGLIQGVEFIDPCDPLPTIGWFASGGELTVGIAAAAGRGNGCNGGFVGNRYIVRVDPLPVGACCLGSVGCAVLPRGDIPLARLAADPAEQDSCQARGGVFQGFDTVCGTDPNDPNNTNFPCDATGNSVPPLGTCCNRFGGCTITTQAACDGNWTSGGVCTPSPCTITDVTVGRCCSAGFCSIITPAACSALADSTFNNTIFTCYPNDCPAPVVSSVVCCRGSTCALVASAAACTTPAGALVGAATASGSACNTAATLSTPCCYADFDKAGGRTIDDIFIFLNAWFARSPYAKVGGDGVALPTIDDIFIFLNAWFAGC